MMNIQKLTKEQAAIISGFTGILCGEFSDFHADVEKRLGRSVQTFEFSLKEFMTEVKKLYKADFIEIGTVDKEQATVQAVPEGFVLVSKTPSLEVLDRLFAEHDLDEDRATYIYRDIINAQEPTND
jgi:hypothetical protein